MRESEIEKRKEYLYVTEREVRRVFYEKKSLIVPQCNKTYLIFSDLNSFLPCSIFSLLQEYEYVFQEEILDSLPPL